MKDYSPTEIRYVEKRLSRDAAINGRDYPIYTRGYYFEFQINTVKVKVHGDIRYKVDEWNVGDILEFDPEYVYIVGEKTAVVPLALKYEMFKAFGWKDRVEKIAEVLRLTEPSNKPLN